MGRDWDEARRYGFISAGGGAWYSGTLRLLDPGDRVWVKAPGYDFVGVGVVRGEPVAMRDFELRNGEGASVPAADILTKASYHREFIDDLDRCEYFVPIEWIATVGLDRAVHEVGMFGNQNSVCAPKTPKWRHTVDRLKTLFPAWDKPNLNSAT